MSGCSFMSRTPPIVSVSEAPHAFAGLITLAESADKNGDPVPVRLFMIHGIGVHQPDWGKANYLDHFVTDPEAVSRGWRIDAISDPQPVQWDQPSPGDPSVSVKYPSADFCASLRSYKITDSRGRIRVVAYQLTWSGLTTPFKRWRFQNGDNSGFNDEGQYRPMVNAMVRTVMDENLSDAVLYARDFDDGILNKSVSTALEWFYTGKLEGDETRSIKARSPTVVLTESLGSIMFAEAVAQHQVTLRAAGKEKEREGMESALRNLETIFMMANQIALLDMPAPDPSGGTVPRADLGGAAAGAPLAALKAVAQARMDLQGPAESAPAFQQKGAGHRRLLIAAFNDVYDILSYRVSPDVLPVSNALIDNFYPANAPNILGIIESPADAHENYGSNAQVYKLVMEGYAPPK
jgi:hypothetical protein